MATYWTQIRTALACHGVTANMTVITGTACPCITSRDPEHPAYSPEWHRLNPAAASCAGTGLISRTNTVTSIRAFFYEAGISGDEIRKLFKTEVIGELSDTDLLMVGTMEATTGAFVELQRDAVVALPRGSYRIFSVSDLMPGDLCAQWAILKRIS